MVSVLFDVKQKLSNYHTITAQMSFYTSFTTTSIFIYKL